MVEIPKVYSTDIVSTDAEGNTVTTSESHYPLFSFEVNEGWTLIDSQIGTETDAYDYYLYAYDTALAPNGAATLFNEVTFSNITEDFVNSITGEEIVDLAINVTGYAIQSDYYNNEATDAVSAWTLYVNQNNWVWPDKPYEGLVSVNYLSENDELVNTDLVYAGAPVTMYFESSLAKDGYTFDWVDETTGETAYSGMTVEEDTNLTATYTETGYGSKTSDFFKYMVYKDENGELYASVIDADVSHEDFPTSPSTFVIPSYIIYQKETTEPEIPVIEITTPNAAGVSGNNGSLNDLPDGTTYIPVKKVSFSYGKTELSAVMETLVIPDTVTSVMGLPRPNLANEGNSTLKCVNIPYGTTYLHSQLFMNFTALESIQLPQTLTTIETLAFWGSGIKDIIIPQSVQVLGREAFRECKSLETIEMPLVATDTGCLAYECTALKTVIIHAQNGDTLGNGAFRGCTNLETVILPEGLKVIEENIFYNATKLANITLPNSLEAVKNYAFYGTSLTNVSVPSICVVDEYSFPSTCTVTYR